MSQEEQKISYSSAYVEAASTNQNDQNIKSGTHNLTRTDSSFDPYTDAVSERVVGVSASESDTGFYTDTETNKHIDRDIGTTDDASYTDATSRISFYDRVTFEAFESSGEYTDTHDKKNTKGCNSRNYDGGSQESKNVRSETKSGGNARPEPVYFELEKQEFESSTELEHTLTDTGKNSRSGISSSGSNESRDNAKRGTNDTKERFYKDEKEIDTKELEEREQGRMMDSNVKDFEKRIGNTVESSNMRANTVKKAKVNVAQKAKMFESGGNLGHSDGESESRSVKSNSDNKQKSSSSSNFSTVRSSQESSINSSEDKPKSSQTQSSFYTAGSEDLETEEQGTQILSKSAGNSTSTSIWSNSNRNVENNVDNKESAGNDRNNKYPEQNIFSPKFINKC